MRRAAALLTLLALLVPVPVAAGQSDPFGPLPQPPPAPAPPAPEDDDDGTGDVGRETLFLVGAGVLLAFFAIGWAITRDARRNLTEDDRATVEGTKHPDDVRRQRQRSKERARAKTKAQRQARKKHRR